MAVGAEGKVVLAGSLMTRWDGRLEHLPRTPSGENISSLLTMLRSFIFRTAANCMLELLQESRAEEEALQIIASSRCRGRQLATSGNPGTPTY